MDLDLDLDLTSQRPSSRYSAQSPPFSCGGAALWKSWRQARKISRVVIGWQNTHTSPQSTLHYQTLTHSNHYRRHPSQEMRKDETPHPQFPHLCAQNLQILPGVFSLAPQRRRARAGGDGDESVVPEEYSAAVGVGGYEDYYY